MFACFLVQQVAGGVGTQCEKEDMEWRRQLDQLCCVSWANHLMASACLAWLFGDNMINYAQYKKEYMEVGLGLGWET